MYQGWFYFIFIYFFFPNVQSGSQTDNRSDRLWKFCPVFCFSYEARGARGLPDDVGQVSSGLRVTCGPAENQKKLIHRQDWECVLTRTTKCSGLIRDQCRYLRVLSSHDVDINKALVCYIRLHWPLHLLTFRPTDFSQGNKHKFQYCCLSGERSADHNRGGNLSLLASLWHLTPTLHPLFSPPVFLWDQGIVCTAEKGAYFKLCMKM